MPSFLPAANKVYDTQQIGAIIRQRRKALGYTQEHVAHIMGCSPRLIGEIERGKKTVGTQRVLDYATGLGIDISFTPKGERSTTA